MDTTYMLPLAGIAVKGVERDALRKLRASGHEVFASDISVFELLAKGGKLAAEGLADEERVLLGVRSILEEEGVRKVVAYDDEVARTALALRRHHPDFIDCLILASALQSSDALATEDEDLTRNETLMKVVKSSNPKFVISAFRKLLST